MFLFNKKKIDLIVTFNKPIRTDSQITIIKTIIK